MQAGWDELPRSVTEQRTFTDGRIMVTGKKARRGPQKRSDYLLQYTRDLTIAVVEAKAAYKSPGTGLQQAKDYAEILGLKFAYATNGEGIVEFDYLTGLERHERLSRRLRSSGTGCEADRGSTMRWRIACSHLRTTSPAGAPRYYQEIAINRVVQAVLQEQRRILLT